MGNDDTSWGDGSPKEHLQRIREAYRRQKSEIQLLQGFVDCMYGLLDEVESLRGDAEVTRILDMALEESRRLLDASGASLLAPDDATGELVFVVVHGDAAPTLLWQRLSADTGIAGWVARHRRPTIVNNAYNDDRFYRGVDERADFTTRSLLAVPVVGGGELLGVTEMVNKRDDRYFTVRDQVLLTLVWRLAGELLHDVMTAAPGEGSIVDATDSLRAAANGGRI